MALSRVKTWSAGEVLTASDLNTEFNNIITNALTLVSPVTGNFDLDGNKLILDSDADSSWQCSADDRADLELGGTVIHRMRTVASAVNGIDYYGSATGNQPYIQAVGTDSNFGLDIRDSNGNEIIITDGVASAVNEIKVTNAATTNNPRIDSSGEANTGLIIGDSNGNEIIIAESVASAVNEVTVINAATGVNPTIQSSGEANTGIILADSNGNQITILESVANAVNEITITNAASGNNPGISVTGANGTGINFDGAINEDKGSDIASATTTDIGAANGNYVDITGTTTITGLGTVQQGTRRKLQFDGSLTLTHNGSSLILPGAVDLTVNAGDIAEFISLGSGNWKLTDFQQFSTTPQISIGSWTPTIQDSSLSDAEGQTYTTQSGRYLRFAEYVFFDGYLNVSSAGTLTGADSVRLAGLPVTSKNEANNFGHVVVTLATIGGLTAGYNITGTISSNTNHAILNIWDTTLGTSAMTVTEFGTGTIAFYGFYKV